PPPPPPARTGILITNGCIINEYAIIHSGEV
ncbi:hypothetical protein CP09DC79_0439B, partial [Chlamydia psittaci 09DC79]